jgi:hypothetical protein
MELVSGAGVSRGISDAEIQTERFQISQEYIVNFTTPKKAQPLAYALLLAFALSMISACGGGGTSVEAADPPPISKSQLLKKGDAICEKTDKIQIAELNAYFKKHPASQKSKAAYVKMIRLAGLPPVANEIEKLTALGAPKGDGGKVGAILASYEKALKTAEANTVSILSVSGGPFAGPEKLAAQYGFKACAEPL